MIELPENCQAIIFDLDGTLADTMPLHYKASNEVCKQYGFEFPYDFFLSEAGRPTLDVFEDLIKNLGLDLDGRAIGTEKEKRFLELIHEVTPIKPIYDLAIAQKGKLPMAIGSGGQRHSVNLTLEVLKMTDFFDAVVSCDDVTNFKPHPETFLKGAEIMGVNPQNCVVFEDGDPGIKAAIAAGMHYIDIRKSITNY